MTYKIIVQVGSKKQMFTIESEEELSSKDVYVDKVLKKKDKVNPKSNDASYNFIKNMFGI